MNSSLKDGIDWVGYIDWTIRDFHGYRTDRGSTYNSYLVRDEKTALIDTVKDAYAEDLLSNVSALIDPSKIDYVVCNHAEPDHSGSLPKVMEACTNAELVCDRKCQKALSMHYKTEAWKWKVVSDGDSISLGKRSLVFVETPMVHWPESMMTYVPEEALLFSMDAFGQHYASGHRFDDEGPLDTIMAEALTYYANIVMLYGKPIARVMERAAGLDISMIAPSHGVVWRKHIETILAAYNGWVQHRPKAKVVVLYDTMWKSTQMMASSIMEGILEEEVEAVLFDVRDGDLTGIAASMLDASTVACGSPTLNMTLMPQMAATLTYLRGLKPAGKAGFAFGSYGWSKGAARDIEKYLTDMKIDILRESIQVQFVPKEDTLKECREAGRMLAEHALEVAAQSNG